MISNGTVEDGNYSTPVSAFLGCIFAFISLTGIVGNSAVVYAIIRETKLHTRSHFLMASLASADLLVSVLIVPFSALMILHVGYKVSWVACQLFIFLDVMCCTASILHLCAIAWVRFKTVSTISLQVYSNDFKFVLPTIFMVWMLAAFLSIAPYLIFPSSASSTAPEIAGSLMSADSSVGIRNISTTYFQELQENPGAACAVNSNKAYRVFATTVAFYGPLLVILIIYFKMARIAWTRLRNRPGLSTYDTKVTKLSGTKLNTTIFYKVNRSKKKEDKNPTADNFLINNNTNGSNVKADKDCSPTNCPNCKQIKNDKVEVLYPQVTNGKVCDGSLGSGNMEKRKRSSGKKTESEIRDLKQRWRKEVKIIKTLGLVIGAFIFCWLPFFLKEIILPFCDSCEISLSIEAFINWLGYANSAINPFIYAFSNADFHAAFIRLLKRNRLGY